jgi:hypothetical protein
MSEGGAQSSSIVGPPVPLCRYLCVVGDNTDYCTPDSSWSVRGVLEAMSRYHGNAALMHDALRILCHVARGPDVRLVEGEDMTIAIPALTAVFQGTLVERLGRSERMAAPSPWFSWATLRSLEVRPQRRPLCRLAPQPWQWTC